MQIPTKKLNNGFEMPVFGLGTYGFGGGYRERGDGKNDEQEITVIKAAVKLGITHIDTAEIYAEGRSEELAGEAIKEYDRSKLFLVSKIAAYNLTYKNAKQAIFGSLKRLGTDYLDLYLMHRYPGSDDNLKGCLKAMAEMKEQGLIKNLGISNFNLGHTRQAQEWSKYPIVATQVHYSLRFREPEKAALLNFCQQNNIMLIAWRPLGLGTLQKGKIDISREPMLMELGKKYGKSPAQIAINWLLSQKNVVTLSKTSNIQHLQDNLGAVGWQMEAGDIELLRNEFPDQQSVSDTVPLG